MKFSDFGTKLKKFNFNKAFTNAFTPGIKSAIPDMIEARIYATGTIADGTKLQTDKAINGFYAPYTIGLKKKSGQKTSNVTLRDSGEFWDSMRVDVRKYFFQIKADYQKEDDHISNNFQSQFNDYDFERRIEELTPQEKYEIAEMLKTNILNELRNL